MIEYHHKKTSSILEDLIPAYFRSQKIKLKNNRKNKKMAFKKKMFFRMKAISWVQPSNKPSSLSKALC
jgi:hypothetical protein